jgi:hypothetical protein
MKSEITIGLDELTRSTTYRGTGLGKASASLKLIDTWSTADGVIYQLQMKSEKAITVVDFSITAARTATGEDASRLQEKDDYRIATAARGKREYSCFSGTDKNPGLKVPIPCSIAQRSRGNSMRL